MEIKRVRNVSKAMAMSMPALKPATRSRPPNSGTSGRSGLCISLPTIPARLRRGIAKPKPTKATANEPTSIESARHDDGVEISIAPLCTLKPNGAFRDARQHLR